MIEDQVRKILSKILNLSEDELSDDLSRDNISGWDSIAQLSIVFALEEEFNIAFSSDEIFEKLNSLQEISHLLLERSKE